MIGIVLGLLAAAVAAAMSGRCQRTSDTSD
jgi:hypothetical protein